MYLKVFKKCFLKSKILKNFEILKIFDYWEPIYFFEKTIYENVTQNVLCSNFFENKYFFINPKAKVAPTPLLSKTPKNMTNGPKLKKLSHFFVRVGIKLWNTLYITNLNVLYFFLLKHCILCRRSL